MEPVAVFVEQIEAVTRAALRALPMLALAALVLVLTALLARLVSAGAGASARRLRLRPALVELFSLLGSIFAWLSGILAAAAIVFPDLTPASILAGLGLGSVAIGLAFKDIFENFFAGVLILFRRKMRIGDFVETGDTVGKVEHITLRESHLRQTDGQLVIVPNAKLFKEPVRILTDLDHRRITVIARVALWADVAAARSVMREAVSRCESVVTEGREVEIFAQAFGESAVEFEVTWWTGSTPLAVRRSRDEVMEAVQTALRGAEIEIPVPYRALRDPVEVRRDAAPERAP